MPLKRYKSKSLAGEISQEILLEIGEPETSKEPNEPDSKAQKPKKKGKICYDLASYGLCPFQISFPSFTTFNGKEHFVDHKIIIVSVIFLILIFSYGVSKLTTFGWISGLSEEFYKN